MQASSHKKIVFLLSFSLLSIVLVQAFWLRSFYLEKKEQFRAGVYRALEQIGSKLHEQDQLRVIKKRGDSLLSTRREIVKVMSGIKKLKTITTTRNIKSKGSSVTINDNTVMIATSPAKMAVATAASSGAAGFSTTVGVFPGGSQAQLQLLNKNMSEVSMSFEQMDEQIESLNKALQMNKVLEQQAQMDSAREAGIEELLGRMVTEIRIIDEQTSHPDSLNRLIKSALQSKGISSPYEFSLREMHGTKEHALVQSANYDSTRVTYVGDLSINSLFSTNRFLFLQFPDQQSALMGSIKGSVLLSILFTGIILSVFFYTLRLLLRQKKISDIRNDFVNNMTHELKTPIATISLAVDAMQHPQVRGSEQRYSEYTRILKEENRKLNSHVERVLQLALFDKGQLEVNRREVDLAAVAESQVRAYGLRAESDGIQLFFNKTGGNFNVLADEEHLGSAISNLIDNAIKYTGKNGIVNVNLVSDDHQICVSVSDTGLGIARDELEKVFDKFYRVNNKDLHDVKGFGIGLSYVKSIVEAHGGRISLESEPGKGSNFKITLRKHE